MNRYWWQDTNIYQIYPRSFQDSNGDGIGDLRGIISRLDYLKTLGVETIWLSPINASPMVDNGYDISDYYKIEPVFGTNEDMDELIAEAGKRGMKVLMDLVVNHCSDQHEWFQKALKDPEGEYGKYFYFRKGKEDGSAPNNWRSIFGGPAWEKVPGTDYYYLHIFTKEQVDLNWETPQVREKIYEMINYWLGKGVAGFRIDAINYLKKEPGFPSYPADEADGLVSPKYGSLYRPGINEMLEELKDRTFGRQALTVGEVANVPDEDLMKYVSLEDGHFAMIFDFSFISLDTVGPNYFWCDRRDWDPDEIKQGFFHTQELVQPEGWIANILDSHDTPRAVDLYLPEAGRNLYGASMLAVMNLMRRGTPVIYQGQELGMDNNPLPSIDLYDDCSSHNEYRTALDKGYSEEEALRFVQLRSRDNARYPFSWDETEQAGFTTGTPWLPVSPKHTWLNAKAELADPDSLFYIYKFLLALRKGDRYGRAVREGRFEPYLAEQHHLIAYKQILEEEGEKRQELLILCNYQEEGQRVLLPEGTHAVVFDNYRGSAPVSGEITMKSFQALVLEV